MSEVIGVYPGSFDPLTLGHLDIIKRACKFVDKLIIGVGNNTDKAKSYLLTSEQRVKVINTCLQNEVANELSSKISIKHYEGLLIDFVIQQQAHLIIRGLRASADFDFEFNLAGGNQILNSNVETVFLITTANNQFISSKLVKEVCTLDGDISKFVPSSVVEMINSYAKINKQIRHK